MSSVRVLQVGPSPSIQKSSLGYVYVLDYLVHAVYITIITTKMNLFFSPISHLASEPLHCSQQPLPMMTAPDHVNCRAVVN